MKLFIFSVIHIPEICLVNLFDELIKFIGADTSEISLCPNASIELQNFVFSLCDGIKHDFYIETTLNPFKVNSRLEIKNANKIFIIENTGSNLCTKYKTWSKKYGKVFYVYNIENFLNKRNTRLVHNSIFANGINCEKSKIQNGRSDKFPC
jgi:hypothetical protein